MIPLIITALTSLVAGVLVGGCARPDNEVTKAMIHRNAQLENQVSTHQDALTALSDQHDIIRARREAAEQARRQITQGLYCTGRTARKPKLLLV